LRGDEVEEIKTKICFECGIEKSVNEFRKNKTSKIGVCRECKECARKHDKIYREKNKEQIRKINLKYIASHRKERKKYAQEYSKRCEEKNKIKNFNIPQTKVCSKCKIEKSINEFDKQFSKKDGLRAHCKKCRHEIYLENIEQKKIYDKEYRIKNYDKMKIKCKKYREEHKEEIKNKRGKQYYNNWEENKEKNKIAARKTHLKRKQYYKKYREKNKNQLFQQSKKYRAEQGETLKQKKRLYYQNNKKEIINKSVNYRRERRKKDPLYIVYGRIHAAFSSTLKLQMVQKTQRLFKYTSIPMEQYLKHLKSDPLWNDYAIHRASYNIDHIIPCALYNFSNLQDIKKCWNPKNLRLLSKIENIKKSNKFDINLIKQYKIEHLLPEGFIC
jgi:hypothetical protein